MDRFLTLPSPRVVYSFLHISADRPTSLRRIMRKEFCRTWPDACRFHVPFRAWHRHDAIDKHSIASVSHLPNFNSPSCFFGISHQSPKYSDIPVADAYNGSYTMDPLSITTGVLTLVTRSIGAVQICQTYVAKYQLGGLSIAAVRTECASIRIALLQIQNLISLNSGKQVRRDFEQLVLD